MPMLLAATQLEPLHALVTQVTLAMALHVQTQMNVRKHPITTATATPVVQTLLGRIPVSVIPVILGMELVASITTNAPLTPTTVTQMLFAVTQMVPSHVPVTQGTLGMALHVQT